MSSLLGEQRGVGRTWGMDGKEPMFCSLDRSVLLPPPKTDARLARAWESFRPPCALANGDGWSDMFGSEGAPPELLPPLPPWLPPRLAVAAACRLVPLYLGGWPAGTSQASVQRK